MLNLVGDWIGNVAKLVGLEAWRATFRPDIPTIDRVVELRRCEVASGYIPMAGVQYGPTSRKGLEEVAFVN